MITYVKKHNHDPPITIVGFLSLRFSQGLPTIMKNAKQHNQSPVSRRFSPGVPTIIHVFAAVIMLLSLSALLPTAEAFTSEEVEEWLAAGFTIDEVKAWWDSQPQNAIDVQVLNSAGPGYDVPNNHAYEHVVRRVESQPNCPVPSDAPPVLVAISNRETLVGCHSFHQHLNPKWRTVFVLNEKVAEKFGIIDMVATAGCDNTLGATALLLDNFGGEVLGRRVALDYQLKELSHTNIEFLHQINCDVHPIPRNHKYHQPIDKIVTKMVHDFMLLRATIEPGKYPGAERIPDNAIRRWAMEKPVLAMNGHLFEEFPSMNSLPEQQLHGHDVCSWKGVDSRPDHLRRYPWLCDNSDWVENHMIMFDIEKLKMVRSVLLDTPAKAGVDSYPSSTKLTGTVAYQHGMKVLTNQDVYMHQNFARAANHKEQSLPEVPDWLRVYNIETLASTRSPEMNYRVFNGYRYYAGYIVRISQTGAGFMLRQTENDNHSPWFPENPAALNKEDTYRVIAAMLKLCGYEMMKEEEHHFQYGLLGVYPSDLYVTVTIDKSVNERDSWEILQLQDHHGRTYHYTALGSVATRKMRNMFPSERTVPVPKHAKLISLAPKPNNLDVLHNRGQFKPGTGLSGDYKRGMGECETDDQRVITCCGYLDPPEFERPYY